jgi:ABC-type multidrug transport system fused ATPase/permease subunit
MIFVEKQLRHQLFSHFIDAKIPFLNDHNIGHLSNILITQTRNTRTGIDLYIQLLTNLILATAYACILFYISGTVVLLAGGFSLAFILIFKHLFRKSREIGHKTGKLDSKIFSTTQESLSGILFLKSTNKQDIQKAKFRSLLEDFSKNEYRFKRISTFLEQCSEPVSIIMMSSVFIFMYYVKSLPLDIILVFALTTLRAYPKLSAIQTRYQKLQHHMPLYNICNDMIESAKKAREDSGNTQFEGLNNAIEFKNLTFSYNRSHVILNNINITIPKNATVAFVGKSGGGKSTLAQLLLGLYPTEKGQLLFDNIDSQDLDKTSLRHHIGFLSQDTFLFNDTIRNNLIYGLENILEDDIITACKRANAYEFIQKLENGFDTLVGDRGVKLSGGQRQRIALARVFIKKPSILILDEATSALDNESENYIQNAITELHGKITTIIIAHRLNTIRHADTIYVINEGQCVESGSFDELTEKGRNFSQLYDLSTQN